MWWLTVLYSAVANAAIIGGSDAFAHKTSQEEMLDMLVVREGSSHDSEITFPTLNEI